jgi:hypothetical protein
MRILAGSVGSALGAISGAGWHAAHTVCAVIAVFNRRRSSPVLPWKGSTVVPCLPKGAQTVRIRQVALAARDLEPVVADLCAVLGIEVAYRDPGVEVFGLENAVMPVGDAFLEVVAPTRADTTAGRFLERRRGDAGYMVIVQSDDLEADRRRVEELGVRVVWETRFPDIATIHLHPRDVGGAILSLDVARPPESWRWAGPDWPSHVRSDVTSGITGVELRAADPADLACRWSQVLGQPARRTAIDHWEIALAGGDLRFDAVGDGGEEGFVAFDVSATDRARVLDAAKSRGLATTDDAVRIAGVRIHLR